MLNIKPDKSEILRYLGVRGVADEDTLNVIDDCISELDKIVKHRYIYGIFNVKAINDGEKRIELEGTDLTLIGNDIYSHLKDCPKCAVMAATLGIGADNAIRLAQNSDMLKAIAMDAAASEYIEKLCDGVEDEIKNIAAKEGFNTNFRFSPGYGDLPLDTQKRLLSVIDANRKVGITLTKGNLMVPSKSVTAIIGFTKNNDTEKRVPCDICNMKKSCKFRKEGKVCGR